VNIAILYSELKSLGVFRPLFIWSRLPEITLPPGYRGRGNVSLNSLQNSTNRSQEDRGPVSGGESTRVSELSASAGRVTLASGTTFLYINTLARQTESVLGVASFVMSRVRI